MKSKIIIMALIAASITAQAQPYRQTNQQPFSPILQEVLKIDMSKPPHVSPPKPHSHSPQRANNGWYPVKGEMYIENETEIAGYISHTIGQNGLLDKRIAVCNHPFLYDSTVSVMNRMPYTKGKDLIDTVYNYRKNSDGSYILDMRRIYSFHYFDHFDGDSLYYEYIYQFWNDANKQWINYYREKFGYHDTLVQFENRNLKQSGMGNTWMLTEYHHDSITYNHQGFVDTLYMIRNFGNGNTLPYKIGFTNDEQGSYKQADFFVKQGNTWAASDVLSNITWTEWNGFTRVGDISLFGELISPYKRTKINSYYISSGQFNYFRQKWWDINGTKTNTDTTYLIIGEKLYPGTVSDNIYNEYGDYVEWRGTSFSDPDENGKQKINGYSALYNKYTYDDIYGMTEHKVYLINLLEDGKMDTAFFDGIKYTEFAPVSIVEHPQSSKQTLTIFPNPVSGVVTISAASEIQRLNVFDITGRLVSSQSPASNRVVFDTGTLPQGVYLVQALLKDGRQQTGKVVFN
jgi:hypothetical protein